MYDVTTHYIPFCSGKNIYENTWKMYEYKNQNKVINNYSFNLDGTVVPNY